MTRPLAVAGLVVAMLVFVATLLGPTDTNTDTMWRSEAMRVVGWNECRGASRSLHT